MAYNDYEFSVDSSQPDELFLFTYEGDNSKYTVTSSAFSIDFQGDTYDPIPVSRSVIQRTPEAGKNNMSVRVDRNNDHFARYLVGSLAYATTLAIYSIQPDDSFQLIWSGVVKSVTRRSRDLDVVSSPISTSASRPILHRKYQVQCPHALYSYYCKVDRPTHVRTGTIASASGDTLTSAIFGAEDDGWFAGGTITISNEKKTIAKHVGATITLLDPFYSAGAGDLFSATAGCDHSLTTCDTKFSNALNYGGCPWIPSDDILTSGKQFTY